MALKIKAYFNEFRLFHDSLIEIEISKKNGEFFVTSFIKPWSTEKHENARATIFFNGLQLRVIISSTGHYYYIDDGMHKSDFPVKEIYKKLSESEEL